MKKFLLFAFAFFAISNLTFGQFYDGFTSTGNIGGDCSDATCNNNGWYTHSNSKPATIDIIAGSLSYTGLQASTGNKVYIIGNNLTLARDVNAAITVSGDIAYYSALINVVDTTNLSETGFDYFMHFATANGNTGVTTFFGRLGIKATALNTYHLGLMNTSGSGSNYTELNTDLTCGTTYLVVVKYDKSTNEATLWVNPSTLGGAEPAGSITNNSSSSSISAYGSICIRNGYSSTYSGGTPKAYIDEIRVGTTFASVTPVAQAFNGLGNPVLNVYPNPASEYITINNFEKGKVQIFNAIGVKVLESETATISVKNLQSGLYFVTMEIEGQKYVAKFFKN